MPVRKKTGSNPRKSAGKENVQAKGGGVFAALRAMEFLGPDGQTLPLELQSKIITIGGRKYIQCFVHKSGKWEWILHLSYL